MSSSNFKFLSSDSELVLDFISKSKGLSARVVDQSCISVQQKADSQSFQLNIFEVNEVLRRLDNDSHEFLQINFINGTKILLTAELIGFKPAAHSGLDIAKLPKVVTTPDLNSVADAIEECLSGEPIDSDFDVLVKVYLAILAGAESVGFDLPEQKSFIQRVLGSKMKASA